MHQSYQGIYNGVFQYPVAGVNKRNEGKCYNEEQPSKRQKTLVIKRKWVFDGILQHSCCRKLTNQMLKLVNIHGISYEPPVRPVSLQMTGHPRTFYILMNVLAKVWFWLKRHGMDNKIWMIEQPRTSTNKDTPGAVGETPYQKQWWRFGVKT